MLRVAAVPILLFLLPSAAAQSCPSPPEIDLEPSGLFEPVPLGGRLEDRFEILVRCPSVAVSVPLADVTLRTSIEDSPNGFNASFDHEETTLPGGECSPSEWTRVPNVLRLDRTTPAAAYEEGFYVLVEASCEGYVVQDKRFYGPQRWVAIEGEFSVSPLNQSLTRGQNQDGRFEFTLRSTYNVPLRTLAEVRHSGGPPLIVIPPSQTTLDLGHETPYEEVVLVSLRTPHENGHVNFTSTYDVFFTALPAWQLAEDAEREGPLGEANATFTIHVVGNYVPGPYGPLVLGSMAAAALLLRRPRRDA